VRFLLPPSPSLDIAKAHAPTLRALLAARVKDIVVDVAADYGALGDDVVAGRCVAAWVPPIVGARVEMAGGRVVLRALRQGQTAYRAAIVCRQGFALDVKQASQLTAAWVDEDSAAGYLLARSWLMGNHHIDAITGFRAAFFVGGYVQALEAVASGKADLTSVFASVAAAMPRTTLDEVDPALRAKLAVVGYTGDTRSDGVAIGQGIDDGAARPLIDALAALSSSAEGQAILSSLMQADGLRREAPKPTSTSLQALLMAEAHRLRAGS